ncbi:MAG: hypothetical protein QXQ41_06545 [Candidatus Bathyarchaeia archaeon]
MYYPPWVRLKKSVKLKGCMMIRAVVFDLDGTIVTFSMDYKALRAEVRGFLINQGVPASV